MVDRSWQVDRSRATRWDAPGSPAGRPPRGQADRIPAPTPPTPPPAAHRPEGGAARTARRLPTGLY